MADNTLQTGADNIATDELATLNGGATSGVKAQRVKVGWGVDSDFKDTSATTPLPVTVGAYQANSTGNLTATQSTLQTAVAGGTVVATDLRGIGSATIAISAGTFGAGTIGIDGTTDGTNWFQLPFAAANQVAPTIVLQYTLTANTAMLFNVGPLLGIVQIRVRAITWVSGSIPVIIDPSVQSYMMQTSVNGTVGISGTPAVYPTVRNSGGSTAVTLISAATTNATSVKTSTATLYSLEVSNTTTTVAYLKLYNKASAPTVGTDTPYKTIMLPVSSAQNISFGMAGVAFPTGLAYAITGAPAASDATAVAANQVLLGINYN